MKAPVFAYLTDKTGTIYETLHIIAKNPKKDVEAMNGTCKAYTDGKKWWTLERPIAISKSDQEYLDQEEGLMMARIDDGQLDEDMDGCAS